MIQLSLLLSLLLNCQLAQASFNIQGQPCVWGRRGAVRWHGPAFLSLGAHSVSPSHLGSDLCSWCPEGAPATTSSGPQQAVPTTCSSPGLTGSLGAGPGPAFLGGSDGPREARLSDVLPC